MDWLVNYYLKNEEGNGKFRRFFDKSEDYIDGYIDKLKEVGGPDLVVIKEKMD